MKATISVLAFFGLLCCLQAQFLDHGCHSRGGICTTTFWFCYGGEFVSGLCGGPFYRRCCVSIHRNNHDSQCSDRQKEIACDLLTLNNVRPADSHSSGNVDDANAYKNLQDMCNGGEAARSSYRCNPDCYAPGGSVCLSLKLLSYLRALADTGVVQINELAGGCHSCNSRHYSGLAVDLHKHDHRKNNFTSECRDHGGVAITERNHIHCQFYDQPHPSF